MTVFDALLLAVLGFSIFFAAMRGAIRELATLAGLAIAALVAWFGAKPLVALLGKDGSFLMTVAATGMLGILAFGGFYFLIHKGLLRLKLTKKQKTIDRYGGGVFGLIRALALIGLGFLGYGYYLDAQNQPDAVKKAFLLPVATASAGFFEQFAPRASNLGGTAKEEPADPARQGYGQAARSGLKEIVTTVTTSDKADAKPGDPIADIITKEEQTDGEPNSR